MVWLPDDGRVTWWPRQSLPLLPSQYTEVLGKPCLAKPRSSQQGGLCWKGVRAGYQLHRFPFQCTVWLRACASFHVKYWSVSHEFLMCCANQLGWSIWKLKKTLKKLMGLLFQVYLPVVTCRMLTACIAGKGNWNSRSRSALDFSVLGHGQYQRLSGKCSASSITSTNLVYSTVNLRAPDWAWLPYFCPPCEMARSQYYE